MIKRMIVLAAPLMIAFGVGCEVGSRAGLDRPARGAAVSQAKAVSPPAATTTPAPAEKYWIIQYVREGRAVPGINYVIRTVGGELRRSEVPEAHRDYFNVGKEGETIPLPPHADDWDSNPADAEDKELVSGRVRDLGEKVYMRSTYFFAK
jgi:hypothetical protein